MIDSDCACQEVNHELSIVHLGQRCKSFRNLGTQLCEISDYIPFRNLNLPYI
jgi:hypothetical protein